MKAVRVLALAALAWGCLAAGRKPPEGRAATGGLSIRAELYTDRKEIRQMLGSDLGGSVVVARVHLEPLAGSKLAVARDDFLLRSDRDGQRAAAYAPSQLAGGGTMVVASIGGGGLAVGESGPVWGPISGGRPRRLGSDGGAIGNTETSSSAAIQTGSGGEPDPVLKTLEELALPEGDLTGPSSGLLYFLLEGKHRPKDLELLYRGPAGKLSLRFKN